LEVGPGLQEAGRDPLRGARHRIVGGVVVAVQIALALLLLTGAGLLVRTIRNLERVDLGFSANGVLLFRLDPTLNGFEGPRAVKLYAQLLDRLRGIPGVVDASMSSSRLISNNASIGNAARPDEPAPPGGSPEARTFQRSHQAWVLIVDEHFFATMRIPMARGRTFEAADEQGGPVAVINRSLARQLYGSEDAIGRPFRLGTFRRTNTPPVQVI